MVIWIDVGTHKAQEVRSVFGSVWWLIWRIFRHTVSSTVLRRGQFIGLNSINKIWTARHFLSGNRENFRIALVEPNYRLLTYPHYTLADDVFCLALAGESSQSELTINRLFHATDGVESQGNSIYRTKHNVSLESFSVCVTCSAESFAYQYKQMLDSLYTDYEVILRINCEGSEDDVIYAFSKYFDDRFKFIFGSLKDVAGVKGAEAYDRMYAHISNRGLQVIDMGTRVESWVKAHQAISGLLVNFGSKGDV